MLTLIAEDESLGAQRHTSPRSSVNSWADETGQVFARAYASGAHRWINWRGLGRFSFRPGSTEVRVRACPTASSRVLHATFNRVVQPVILQALGWQALHASGVTGPSGAVIFCGLGRSGKSTLAYAAGRRAGYAQFADDAVVIQSDGGPARVCPLPFATGLRQDSDRFLRSSGSKPNADLKDQEDLEARPGSSPIDRIFVLSQDASATADVRIDRVGAADAFALLLTHAHCFDETDPIATRRMVEAYLGLAEHVPVLALTYRPDFTKLEALVDSALGTTALHEH